ncbi:MAG TPA: SRPBCC domain-containing protein [Candidatus Saccharimonadales bacterium]|nr:SRPBCC domain-containing protein [Candidatus Saccharimonadales bacterium]
MDQNMQKGIVETVDGRAILTFKRFLPYTTDVVWRALTDPEQFGKWYNAEAEINPKVGGMFTVHSGPFTWHGPITIWDPSKRFQYEHNHDPVPEMPDGAQTVVTWTLAPKDSGTELTFTQSGLTTTAGFAPGTHVVLDRLAAFVENTELPDFGSRFGEIEYLYPVWTAPSSEAK